MNRFLLKRFLLSLLVAAILTPPAYASNKLARVMAQQSVTQKSHVKPRNTSEEPFIRTELFFGTSRQNGPDVTEEEFLTFLKDVITERFPDGLTVLTGLGQFRNSNGEIIQETSKIVVLLYPKKEKKEKSEKIEEIRNLYKEQFGQESVLRVDDLKPVWVSF